MLKKIWTEIKGFLGYLFPIGADEILENKFKSIKENLDTLQETLKNLENNLK